MNPRDFPCALHLGKHLMVYIGERGGTEYFACACTTEGRGLQDREGPTYRIVEPDEEARALEAGAIADEEMAKIIRGTMTRFDAYAARESLPGSPNPVEEIQLRRQLVAHILRLSALREERDNWRKHAENWEAVARNEAQVLVNADGGAHADVFRRQCEAHGVTP